MLAIAVLGLAGSAVVAATSYAIGAREQVFRAVGHATRHAVVAVTHPTLMRPLYYVGVAVVVLAWLGLGRYLIGSATAVRWQTVRHVAWLWSAPMLFAAPIASRDLWAYAAQGNLYLHGFNPYHTVPLAVHGRYLQQVSPVWRRTTAPYGPLWMLASRAAIGLSRGHLLIGVLLLRAVSALGLLAVALAVPRLCRATGAPISVGMWLFCASPLVLLITLGGGHNDLLMLGLLMLGVLLAVTATPAWCSLGLAAVLVTAAAEVKLPALIGLAFLPHVWLKYAPAADRWRRRRGALVATSAIVLAVGAIVVGLVRLMTGLGFGWVARLNASDTGTVWLSIPVALALLTKDFRGGQRITVLGRKSLPMLGKMAAVLAVVVLPTLWWIARKREPLRWLALSLLAGLLLSTAVQPWYLVWPLAVAAVVPLRRAIVLPVAVAMAALTLSMQPAGMSVLDYPSVVPITVLAGLAAWLLLSRARVSRGFA